ncbi:sn-glycerol-3-phosphate ABC transporter ATP-binding protein UgpC [Tissierella pigra]|uniref:ABC transporter ATP-binding protein n=1 Tax=Tissierella pigra TaxID=2607614 RepID=UPI001C0FEC9F|nr:sn-glycerol-3-phosphate ABC transporter ATP-binding protein UgpC [Tissierella pigra]MBU5427543.1 sn-glycerol-3-phosphate ABC transporter ATP-binding protein UgpC [Tissierella pigra]
MGKVVFKNIKKIYPGNVIAVEDFNLEIEDKEFIVLIGPSGCGKSTVLRMLAGLEDITAGELFIDGKKVNKVVPKNRDIAMVFQNYALYPHMTVYENMAIGLKLRKIPKMEIDSKIRFVAKLIKIEELLDRKPKALSGGQQQRVALGRAIVRNPNVFLMDEPLSNLDAKLRVQMRTEIIKLHKELSATFIYVTHDQTEAMTMGTKIVVMKDGVVQQVASPMEIYDNPVNIFVAGFIGIPQMNFIDVKIVMDNENTYMRSGNKELNFKISKSFLNIDWQSDEMILGIRPEHIHIEPIQNSIELVGTVDIVEHMGAETYIHIQIGDEKLIIRVPYELNKNVEDKIKIFIDETKLYLFDKTNHKLVCRLY